MSSMKALSLVFVFFAESVFGCSIPIGSKLRPAEMVEQADVIVLAEITGASTHALAEEDLPTVLRRYGGLREIRLDIVEILKGEAVTSISLPGRLVEKIWPNEDSVPYFFSRPVTAAGQCFAYEFRLQDKYLLFLKDHHPYWSALSPTTEQVRGPDDPLGLVDEGCAGRKRVSELESTKVAGLRSDPVHAMGLGYDRSG